MELEGKEITEINIIRVITLDEQVENLFLNSLIPSPEGISLKLDANVSGQILINLGLELDKCTKAGYKKTAVLCNPRIRLYFARFIERRFRGTRVISYAEIAPDFKVQVMGIVRL